MRELKLEDCKVGMTLKLKEGCPFKKYWKIDPKEPVKCIVLEVIGSQIDRIFVDIYYKNGRKCVPRNWYFYTEDSIIEANGYELISKNLEYPNKRKNNYY